MLPIIDYGGIAIVVPKINAVGGVVDDEGKHGFEVYLTGMEEPLIIGFETPEEAAESREELVAIIAQYHYVKEFGPDFDIDDLANVIDESDVEEYTDEEDQDKEKH